MAEDFGAVTDAIGRTAVRGGIVECLDNVGSDVLVKRSLRVANAMTEVNLFRGGVAA